MFAVGRRPRAPLGAVDGAKFAVGVGPFVPDRHAVVLQPAHVGRALEEPQQFIDDGLDVHLLGGHQREAVLQVEAHLVAEHGTRAGAGAVGFVGAMFVDMAHQVEIRLHASAGEEAGRRKSGEAHCNLSGAVSTVPAVSGNWPGRIARTAGLTKRRIVDVPGAAGRAGWPHRFKLSAGE